MKRNYGLPSLPPNRRWYLARTSEKYADLKLQERNWFGGWSTLTYESINTSGKYHPLDECIRQAAGDCMETMEAPKPEYGVIT